MSRQYSGGIETALPGCSLYGPLVPWAILGSSSKRDLNILAPSACGPWQEATHTLLKIHCVHPPVWTEKLSFMMSLLRHSQQHLTFWALNVECPANVCLCVFCRKAETMLELAWETAPIRKGVGVKTKSRNMITWMFVQAFKETTCMQTISDWRNGGEVLLSPLLPPL